MRILFNGQLIEAEAARLSVLDSGLLHGFGLFETMRCVAERIPFLAAHLDRLEHSARQLGIPLPQARESLIEGLRLLVADAGLKDARVRLTLTMASESQSALFATAHPHVARTTALRACFIEGHPGAQAATRGHKTLSYLPWLLARRAAEARGSDEALMLDAGGLVIEGSTTNLFVALPDGAILTPALETGPLAGVMRAWALARLVEWGQPVEEGLVTRTDVLQASEVFVTNALHGVVPVEQIESRRLAQVAGSWSSRLSEAFRATFA